MPDPTSAPDNSFTKVRSVRAHEQIVEQLSRKILQGEIRSGSRLPSERAMMNEFHVSRPTVREALRVAEHLGLVSVRHGDPGGPLVIAQPSAGISRVLDGMLQAERVSTVELLEFRMLLDGAVAAQACVQARSAVTRIAELYDQMKAATEPAAFVRWDVRFHHEIAVASGNRLYSLVLEALDRPIQELIATRLAASPANRDVIVAEHGEILANIRSGDREGASQSARHHLFDHYASALSRRDRARLKSVLDGS